MSYFTPTYNGDEHQGNNNGTTDNYGEETMFGNGGLYTDADRDMFTYVTGEMSADHALQRQEYFYNKYQSPAAQMKQLKDAGLSPSIYASGGLPGGSGTSGISASPRQSSTGGTQAMQGILSAVMQGLGVANQIAKTKAEIDNTKADTALKNAQAGKTAIEAEYQNYLTQNKLAQNQLLNVILTNKETQEQTSLFELAQLSNSYSDFMKNIRNLDAKDVPLFKSAINTENGQRILRDIYINSKEQSANIAALNKQETNDELATQILKVLNKEGYAELSAQEQIEALKRSVETNKLDKETSEAWNNLIEKLGDGTKQDTAIVIGLLLRTLIGQTNLSATRSTIVK